MTKPHAVFRLILVLMPAFFLLRGWRSLYYGSGKWFSQVGVGLWNIVSFWTFQVMVRLWLVILRPAGLWTSAPFSTACALWRQGGCWRFVTVFVVPSSALTLRLFPKKDVPGVYTAVPTLPGNLCVRVCLCTPELSHPLMSKNPSSLNSVQILTVSLLSL